MPKLRFTFLPVITMIAMAGPIAQTIFVPAMPLVADYYHTDYKTVQWTFTLYLFAFAVGQLVYGPLSDFFGRRPLLLAGLVLYLIGSVCAALSTTVNVLIVGRILQGLGGGAGVVLSRLVVIDSQGPIKGRGTLGYMLMGGALAPAIAPSIGAFLAMNYGWRSIFFVVAGFALILLGVSLLWLHETNMSRTESINFSSTLRDHYRLLRTPRFVFYLLGTCFLGGTFFCFVGVAPYVVMEILQGTPADYGLAYILLATGIMLAGFVSGNLLAKIRMNTMIITGSVIALCGAIAMILFAANKQLTLWPLFATMAVIAFGRGLTLSSVTFAISEIFPRNAGSALGFLGFAQLVTGAIYTQLGTYFVHYGVVAFATLLISGVIVSLLCYGLCMFLAESREIPS